MFVVQYFSRFRLFFADISLFLARILNTFVGLLIELFTHSFQSSLSQTVQKEVHIFGASPPSSAFTC